VLSAAITAALALGRGLEDAVAEAKRHITRVIEAAPEVGHGSRCTASAPKERP